MTPDEVIRLLNLQPLAVEGGYFRETWRATEGGPSVALAARYAGARSCGSAIYYLLTSAADCFSALHRLATDEIYHFYLGDPVELLLLSPGGRSRIAVLGPDLPGGQAVQFIVPADTWQGSRLLPGGRFALLGTTMAPGFDPQDFVLGNRQQLLSEYPSRAEMISALTR
jgi:hypothetical protein